MWNTGGGASNRNSDLFVNAIAVLVRDRLCGEGSGLTITKSWKVDDVHWNKRCYYIGYHFFWNGEIFIANDNKGTIGDLSSKGMTELATRLSSKGMTNIIERDDRFWERAICHRREWWVAIYKIYLRRLWILRTAGWFSFYILDLRICARKFPLLVRRIRLKKALHMNEF